jgi:cold-inducible RNA-binding protein
MMNDSEGDKAIAALNGKDLDGRALNVNEARSKTERPSGGGYGRGQSRY